MRQFQRWALVGLLAAIGGGTGIVVAIALYGVAASFCPAEFLISGMCTVWWFAYAEQVSFALGAGLSAVLVVLSSFAAPRLQTQAAWVAFGGGVLYASWFLAAGGLSVLVPFVFATAAGAYSVRLVHAHFRESP